MKVKPYQINALSSQIKSSYKAALVFGTDPSVIQDTAEQIARYIVPSLKDDFNVIKVFQSQLKEHPSLLTDEGNALSFMGGRKLIWLKEADTHATEAVMDFTRFVKTDSFLLITTGNLTKSAALRVQSEENPLILAVACYTDDEKNIKNNVLTTLKNNGYTISPEILSILCQRMSENRLAVKSELNKLMTYLGDRKTITNTDIDTVISVTATASIDALCQQAAGIQFEKTDFLYRQLLQAGESPVTLIRYLIAYFNNLLLGIHLIQKKVPLETIFKKILKPNQFNQKEALARQLHYWDMATLIKITDLLFETEKQMKTSGLNPELMLHRTLTLVNSAAKKQHAKYL